MIKLKLTIVGAVKGWFPFFPQHSSHSSLSRLYCTVPLSSLNIHHILLYLDYTVQSLYLPSIFITFFSIQIILYSPFIFPQYSSLSSLSRLYCTVPLIFSSTFITFFSIWIILYSPFIFPSIICPILFTSHPSDPTLKVACSEYNMNYYCIMNSVVLSSLD